MDRLDGHIHIHPGTPDPASLLAAMGEAGIDGGLLISLPPRSLSGQQQPFRDRLENLLAWSGSSEKLFPFFWLDPLEEDAEEQVDAAVESGTAGFKVICNHFYPGEPKALQMFRSIASRGRPILFHSGILWDGRFSSRYNHPEQFEALLDVEGLRFSLAHISWPWCDELIAVFGKFLNAYARRPGLSLQMFVDSTPGTPPIYRRDALTRLLTVGYEVEQSLIFGTDCNTEAYNRQWARQWIERDNLIYDELGLDPQIREEIFGGNLLSFLGRREGRTAPQALRPAE